MDLPLKKCRCGGTAVVEKNLCDIMSFRTYRMKCDRCGLIVELTDWPKWLDQGNPYDMYERIMRGLADEWNSKQSIMVIRDAVAKSIDVSPLKEHFQLESEYERRVALVEACALRIWNSYPWWKKLWLTLSGAIMEE